jgi:hypothetical protein
MDAVFADISFINGSIDSDFFVYSEAQQKIAMVKMKLRRI